MSEREAASWTPVLESEEMDLIVLALAKLSLSRPGWHPACLLPLAQKFNRLSMYEEFRKHGPDNGGIVDTFDWPDGRMELGCSGCCCPPGAKRSGQHTNSSTDWYRIDGGEWVQVTRPSSRFRNVARSAKTLAGFWEALKSDEPK